MPAGDIYDIIEALEAGYGYGQHGHTAGNNSSDVYEHDYYRLDVVQRDERSFMAASRAWLDAQQQQQQQQRLGQQWQGVQEVQEQEQGQEGGAEGDGGRAVEGRRRRQRPVPSWSGLDPDPERMALKLAFQGEAFDPRCVVVPAHGVGRLVSLADAAGLAAGGLCRGGRGEPHTPELCVGTASGPDAQSWCCVACIGSVALGCSSAAMPYTHRSSAPPLQQSHRRVGDWVRVQCCSSHCYAPTGMLTYEADAAPAPR